MPSRIPFLAALALLPFLALTSDAQRPDDGSLGRTVAEDAGSADAPILFCVGVHIEPHGLAGGGKKGPQGRPAASYHEVPFFEKSVADIRLLAEIVEAHHGKLTVQAQSPFIGTAVEEGETVLGDLEEAGHEIALHFHEDAQLGRGCEELTPKKWADRMKEEIATIKEAGATRVRYWSGGNLYPGLLEAAHAAGLDVMGDYKNPRIQKSDKSVLGLSPWRPSGGPAEGDLEAFSKHDPDGEIVYLPSGIYSKEDYAASRRSEDMGGDWKYFDFMTESLETSLRAARKDRVNVFHLTVHPGEFRGGPRGQFAVIETWLSEVIDPLVRAGKVKWATFSAMGDAFRAWEKDHAGQDPRVASATTPSKKTEARGCITFAVNVHDWRNVDESADTLLRLIGIFEKQGVKGDFYLTAPMVEAYLAERPDVVERLKESGMTISYHVRAPHPLYEGFGGRLEGLDDEELEETLRDYETYRLDLATGELDRTKPGGYKLVAEALGRPPVVVGSPTRNQRVSAAALRVYESLGARMTIAYHESGTKMETPLEFREGLVIRPSDFSITRWKLDGEQADSFWWNRLEGKDHDSWDPATRLAEELEAWEGTRPPFVTALIHENNFYRFGPESWTMCYYKDRKKAPLDPPFDLEARDESRPRRKDEAAHIWTAYEALVAEAKERLRVVSSEEIVGMAEEGR